MKNNSCGQTLKWYVYSDVFFIQSYFVIVYKWLYPLFLYNILYIFFQAYLSALQNEDALDTHDNHLLMWSPWTRIEKWQKSFLLIYLNTVFLLKQLFMYERKARLMNCNYGPSLISNLQFLKKPGNKPVIRFDSGCLRITPARLRLAGCNSHTRPHKTNNLYILFYVNHLDYRTHIGHKWN